MNSTPNAHTSTPDDVLAAQADERLAHAYEQIARADEQLARLTEQLSRLESDGARRPSVGGGWQASRGRPLLRGFTGLALAACICAAAFAAQSPYGETAKLMVAQWAPQFVSISPPQPAVPGPSTQPIPSSVQLAAAEPTPSQPTSSLQTPTQEVAPTPVPSLPELMQMLQKMADDIAVVEQGIEQLKASQERMFADNARAIEELKAEQLTRVAEKPSGQDPRTKTPALPPGPRTVANTARKPPPTPQARAQPVQVKPEEQ